MAKSLRVLIVEDLENDALLIVEELKAAGYEVTFERVETEDAMEAALDKGGWDVILSDYKMPSFSAPDALQTLKKKDLDLPFIVISGTIGEETAVSMMKNGVHDYIMKGNLTRLSGAIEREIRDAALRVEHKKATQDLRRSEESLKEAQRIAGVGSWDLDLIRNELFWSDEVYRIFEIDPKVFGGSYEAFLGAIHSEDREAVDRAYAESVRNKAPYEIVHRLLMKDGRVKYVLERCETVYDPSGRAVRSLGTVQDITERKKIDHMKDVLIRDVSHSLKTPIAIAKMGVNMLDRGFENADEKRISEARRIVRDSVEAAHRDINNILELYVMEQGKKLGKKEDLSIVKIATEAMEDVRHVTEHKKIGIKIDVPGDADKVLANEKEIRMLLFNVIDNAIKFTDKGSISVLARRSGKMVEITVEDTGCGIADEEKNNLFQRFYQRHASIDGVGLGLTICKEIVGRHNGSIEVASKGLGKGTTVTIRLPRE